MGSTARTSPGSRSALGLLLAVVTAVLLWWAQGDGGTSVDPAPGDSPSARASASHDYTATTTPTTDPTSEPSAPATDPGSGLPVVAVADLPVEARDVLERIDAGGPFKYDRDGVTFENREDLLPQRPLGHYREYTVEIRPGDRGPWRIVAGDDGERYWTEDHYASFAWIEPGIEVEQ